MTTIQNVILEAHVKSWVREWHNIEVNIKNRECNGLQARVLRVKYMVFTGFKQFLANHNTTFPKHTKHCKTDVHTRSDLRMGPRRKSYNSFACLEIYIWPMPSAYTFNEQASSYKPDSFDGNTSSPHCLHVQRAYLLSRLLRIRTLALRFCKRSCCQDTPLHTGLCQLPKHTFVAS